MAQIDQEGPVYPQKTAIGLQQRTQLVQAADALQNRAIGQMDKQGPVQDLTVLNLSDLHPGNTVFAP